MNTKIEAHQNHKLERKISLVKSWNVPDTTKEEVLIFVEKARIGQVQEGKRLSDRTISKYLSLLKKVLEIINKTTDQITKKDVEHMSNVLVKENLKSITNYYVSLKVFLSWKINKEKSQEVAGWLDIRDKNKTPDYLTEQEIKKLFHHCKNPRERFLIAVLFDSGARAEEFLNIRLEDVQLPEEHTSFVKIMLKEEYSKTKGRNISLYWPDSLMAVRDFLQQRKDDKIRSNEPIYDNTRIKISFYDANRTV